MTVNEETSGSIIKQITMEYKNSVLFVFPQFVAETDLSLAKGALKLS